MAFADTYFARFKTGSSLIESPPAEDLFLSIVIPSCREPELVKTLESLKNCTPAPGSIEVIVIINHSEDASAHTRRVNADVYAQALAFAKANNRSNFRFHICLQGELPRKNAGVGLARKIGMDEALRRFNILNRPKGIIAGLDADSTVRPDYCSSIARHFATFTDTSACSIHFEHPLDEGKYPPEILRAIVDYELHLRYFVECLRRIRFPYAYHTIGSAFAVQADVYAAQGGMNRKKAGEDFYFLQKIIPQGKFSELNTTVVYPSPRISDRVPFGTGAAVKKILHEKNKEYLTYNFDAFLALSSLFFQTDKIYNDLKIKNLHPSIQDFILEDNFQESIDKIRKNVRNYETFHDRFFRYFNAFKVIKFLNFAHTNYFQKISIDAASRNIWPMIFPGNEAPDDPKERLYALRMRQKNN